MTPAKRKTAASAVLKTIGIALKMLRWGVIIICAAAAVYLVLWNLAVATALD